jgi:UDP-glucose 4-epimerase
VTWLVTGGAGYIGGHVVRGLRATGTPVVVLDDLSTGAPHRVPGDVPFIVADAGDEEAVRDTIRRYRVDGVMHLAGRKSAPESNQRPVLYYRENVGVVIAVLQAMLDTGVHRLVFSSSAAVYGVPGTVAETSPLLPLTPYGRTKLAAEQLIEAAGAAHGLSWIALRYFNAVGAAAAHLGDHGATNLLPLTFDAVRTGEPLVVAGADLPTADGTGVRDYVHVTDLAEAHRLAAAHLGGGPRTGAVYNVGAGRGHSVLDVVRTVEEVTGSVVPRRFGPPRPGDPAAVVAAIDRIRAELGWCPRHTLGDAVRSAWECHLPTGPFSRLSA